MHFSGLIAPVFGAAIRHRLASELALLAAALAAGGQWRIYLLAGDCGVFFKLLPPVLMLSCVSLCQNGGG